MRQKQKNPSNLLINIGQKFNRLTVIRKIGEKEIPETKTHRYSFWLCRCDCGKEVSVRAGSLLNKYTQSCGCLKNEKSLERLKEYRKKRVENSSSNIVYRNYKRSADIKNVSFSLTKDQFMILTQLNCFYCGEKPQNVLNKHASTFIYNGIDRVDNSKGYENDNVVPCCKRCNLMKRDLELNEFIKHIFKICNHTKEGLDKSNDLWYNILTKQVVVEQEEDEQES